VSLNVIKDKIYIKY